MLKKYCSPVVLIALSGNLFLSACATVPTTQEPATPTWRAAAVDSQQGFDANGRLAVKDEGKGSYANFSWQNGNSVQNIEVKTPLGNSVGVLCRDAQGVIVQNSRGKVFQATSVAALSQQLLGFTLPFDDLPQWINGYWVDGEPHQIQADGRLSQSGWLIRRQLRADGKTPKMVELEDSRFHIKLVFDEFDPPSEDLDKAECALRTSGQ